MSTPSGIVAFLFTDVEGSTRLWSADTASMAASLRTHDTLIRATIQRYGGHVFATGGDGFAAAFSRASDAGRVAAEVQGALTAAEWPGPVLTVRIGLHVGEAEERDGDYFGPMVNMAARVMSAGHGGQVLATATFAAAAGVEGVDIGRYRLAGFPDPVPIVQLGPGAFPPLRAPSVSTVDLPSPRTSLIGRDGDVAELMTLVADHRIVTLLGAGGIGKTRLAIEVARQMAPSRPDGVWFVDLTSVAADEAVVGALFEALSLTPEAGAANVAQAAAFLAPRRSIVVLDNCEHVIDGAARLVDDLVTAAPRLCVVATSRELLGVDGERAWRVPSLPTGRRSPAVELFADHARRAGALDPSDDVVVSEICERLDGIPLAIELAAARSASMPLADLRDRLDDRFRLLDGGRRRRRQQTLDATVRWSYDLLDDDERRFLQVLGVFVGSFRTGDAAAVAELGDLESFDLLESLAARSMVAPLGDRHRLLETIRLFALERLVESGRAEAVRNAFLDHFANDPVITDWSTGASLAGQARMHEEYDNFRAAGAWAMQCGRPGDAARIAAALADVMIARGDLDLARDWVHHTDDLDDEQRVKCLALEAHLCWSALDEGFGPRAAEALEVAADRPFDLVPFVLVQMASAASMLDADRVRAEQLYGQAADVASRTSAGGVAEAVVQVYLAAHLVSLGEFERAVASLDAAIVLAPDHLTRPVSESARVLTLILDGRLDDARRGAANLSPISPSSPYRHLDSMARVLGEFDVERPDDTGRLLADAVPDSIARQPSAAGDWLVGFGIFALLRGDVDRARTIADNCLSVRLSVASLKAAVEGWGPDDATGLDRWWAEEAPMSRMMRAAETTRPLLDEELQRWSADS